MATRAVSDEQLQGIADAIKLKSGDDTPMSVADMALRIGLIQSGAKLEMGVHTFASNTKPSDAGIPHNLGEKPKFIAGWCIDPITDGFVTQGVIGGVYISTDGQFSHGNAIDCYFMTKYHSNINGAISTPTMAQTTFDNGLKIDITDKTFVIPYYNFNSVFYAKSYQWIVATW